MNYQQPMLIKLLIISCYFVYLQSQKEQKMKRIFNKLWIAIIAALALMIGACCSHRNSTEIKDLKAQIANLKEQLSEREMACVYGPPEMIQEYGQQTQRMRSELESLEKELERLKKCN